MRVTTVSLLGLVAWLEGACSASGPKRKVEPPKRPASEKPATQPRGTQKPEKKPPTVDEQRIAALEEAVNATRARRHRCWEVALAESLDLRGTIVLEVGFAGHGRVSKVTVVRDSTGSSPAGLGKGSVLAECLALVYRHYQWPNVFAQGVAFQLPFSFRRPSRQYTVSISDVQNHIPKRKFSHASGSVGVGGEADGRVSGHVILDRNNTGNTAISVSLVDMTDKSRLSIFAKDGAELVYVAQGKGVLHTGCRRQLLGANTAIYLPKGTYARFSQRGGKTKLLHVSVPGGAERQFLSRAEFMLAEESSTRQESIPAQRCKAKGIVKRVARVSPLRIAGGKGTVRIVFDARSVKDRAVAGSGQIGMSMGMIAFDPDVEIPSHVHQTSTEVLVMLAGEGVAKIGKTEFPVHAGHVIQIPPATPHSFRGTGAESIRAIQFYTPSGPEQRFRTARGR